MNTNEALNQILQYVETMAGNMGQIDMEDIELLLDDMKNLLSETKDIVATETTLQTLLTNEQLREVPLNINVNNEIEIKNDEGNAIYVQVTNFPTTNSTFISTDNSTNIPLGANQTFTGQWEDVSQFVSIAVVANSDQLASTGGLTIQFTSDVNFIDRSIPIDIVTNGDASIFPVEAQYFRLLINNGATPQSHLRVQTIYSAESLSNKYVPLRDALNDSSLSLITRSIISGKSTVGSGYNAVKVTPNGNLQIDISQVGGTNFSLGQANQNQSISVVLDSTLEVAQGSNLNSANGILHLGAVTTTAPSYTTNKVQPLSLQTDGSLRVSVTSAQGLALDSTLTTINTTLNSLLKPANTLNKVATVDTITNVVNVSDNNGSLTTDKKMGTTPTVTNVAAVATTSTLLIANNTNRISVIIHNDSTIPLFVKFGVGASLSSYSFKIESNKHLIVDDYNGPLYGYWTSATGTARVTENI